MKRLQFILIATLFSYVFTAFVCWNINPTFWGVGGRILFISLWLFTCFFAVILTIRMSSFAKYQKEKEDRQASIEPSKGGFASVLKRQLETAENERKKREHGSNI